MTGSAAALIVQARRSAGLSQAELARRAGMSRSVINVYEHGRREPGADALIHILTAAGHELRAAPAPPPPVDPARAASILVQVLELAEALPYRARKSNDYPPLAAGLA
jgi:transcriptional regulator with XRE-family HTH domain